MVVKQGMRLTPSNVIGRWLRSGSCFMPFDEHQASARVGRLRLAALAMALALVWATQTAAKAWLPMLLRDHPLLLITLDSRTRDLVLVSPKLGIAEFIVVAVAWRFSVHFLYYLLGRWYGDAALRWVNKRSRLGGRVAIRIEQIFSRWTVPAVFLLSNKLVCALAGSTGMRPTVFIPLHLSGTIIRISVLCMILRSNNSRLGLIVDQMDRNAGWLTVLFVIGTIITVTVSVYLHYRGAARLSEAGSERTPE